MAGPVLNEKALARRVKDHVLGSSHDFFAVVHPGFEATAQQELRELGIGSPRIAGSGGIAFSGRLEDAWRVNLGAGTVSRLLMRLDEFKATGFGEFRAKLAAFPWELHLADAARVAFSTQSGRSRLWHEGKLDEEAARAVAERLAAYGRRAQFGARAAGDAAEGQTIYLRVEENRCQVSLDTSGPLLYRRGHGKFVEQAPLRGDPGLLACCARPPSSATASSSTRSAARARSPSKPAPSSPGGPSTSTAPSPSSSGPPSSRRVSST